MTATDPHPAPGAFQADFSRALMTPDRAAAPVWLDPEAAYRFRVYRNNMRHGLAGTLAESFPVVRRLVGDAFFEAAAIEYVERHPPEDRTLAYFGDGFAGFLDAFEPARKVVYLADTARLEWARVEALHAADANPLDPSGLAGLGDEIATARFVPHPSCRLVRSAHPIWSIWRAHQAGTSTGAKIEDRAEAVLITRPALELRMAALDAGPAAFSRYLLEGATAEDAHAQAAFVDPAFDPMNGFKTVLDAGAFQAVEVGERGR